MRNMIESMGLDIQAVQMEQIWRPRKKNGRSIYFRSFSVQCPLSWQNAKVKIRSTAPELTMLPREPH